MYLYFVLATPFLKIYPFGNNKQKTPLPEELFVFTYTEIRNHRDSENRDNDYDCGSLLQGAQKGSYNKNYSCEKNVL